MVLCQVRTEFSGSPGVRENVRAFRRERGCASHISEVYCILPCTLQRSKLKWGGKKDICVHECVCVYV